MECHKELINIHRPKHSLSKATSTEFPHSSISVDACADLWMEIDKFLHLQSADSIVICYANAHFSAIVRRGFNLGAMIGPEQFIIIHFLGKPISHRASSNAAQARELGPPRLQPLIQAPARTSRITVYAGIFRQ